MKKSIIFVALLLAASLSFAQERNLKLVKAPTENQTTETRKAVVVGMSDYGANRALDNTLNDANDMAEVFAQLGFEVTLLKNNDLRNLRTNLTNWYSTIEKNDMAVFYFAGHGIEVAGENYLIPIDAELNSETDVQYSALSVNQVLDNMDLKNVGMKMIILDACRDNPFTRSWNRSVDKQGLTQMAAPKGTFIAFAASPGKTAQDGGNYNLKNGVFTHYLKQEITKEGIPIERIFNAVSRGVSNLTNDRQIPFRNSSITDVFYFVPRTTSRPVTGIELNRTSSRLNVGGLETFTAILSPNNATNPDVTWMSSNPSVATVNAAGRVTAIAAGSTAIIATTVDGGRTAICNVKVQAPNLNVSEDVHQANTYYNTGQYNEAFALYKQAAERGEAVAQFKLALCYDYGLGVKEDDNQAAYWYRKAAEQGDAEAQNELAFCYSEGKGVKQDDKQAVEWWRKAAEQGLAEGQCNLGICYQSGEGVKQDYTQAVYWYRKAAEQGNAAAQYSLGVCYYNGWGVKQDYKQAAEWSRKAAEQGNSDAQNNLAVCYENGWGVKQDDKQAMYWYEKAAEQGDADAQYSLAERYYYGEGVTVDYTQAVYWYEKVAEQGSVGAQYNLGYCYSKGLGVTVDYTRAANWYQKAAEQDNQYAQYELGICFYYGRGVTKDYTQAVEWCRKAAEQGNEDAKKMLKELGR